MVRYVGIDPSISGTGLVILNEKAEVELKTEFKAGKEDDPLRFMRIKDNLFKHLNPDTDKVAIEGFSYGSKGRSISTMYGIGWTLRVGLVANGFSWGEVPPTQVKKFASDKGNAKKEDLVLPVYKKWGFEGKTNNITDAYILSRIVYSMYNHDDLLKYEQDVLKKLKKI